MDCFGVSPLALFTAPTIPLVISCSSNPRGAMHTHRARECRTGIAASMPSLYISFATIKFKHIMCSHTDNAARPMTVPELAMVGKNCGLKPDSPVFRSPGNSNCAVSLRVLKINKMMYEIMNGVKGRIAPLSYPASPRVGATM